MDKMMAMPGIIASNERFSISSGFPSVTILPVTRQSSHASVDVESV
jgi:hypothetical protein